MTAPDPAHAAGTVLSTLQLPPAKGDATTPPEPPPDRSSPAPAAAALLAPLHSESPAAAAIQTAARREACGAHESPACPAGEPHTQPSGAAHHSPEMSPGALTVAEEHGSHGVRLMVSGEARCWASERGSAEATGAGLMCPAERTSDGAAASPLEPGSSVSVPRGRMGPSSPLRQTSADFDDCY